MRTFEERPWGNFIVHEAHTEEGSPNWTLKTLRVKPGAQLSVQSHKLRDETWFLVEGSGEIGIDNPPKWTALEPGKPAYIPRETIHALRGGPQGLTLVEIMTGHYDEDDIVRYADIYGRETVKG